VFGLEAKSVWGQQWVKMLELLYEGVTVGMEGGALIGGQSAEGIASRARVQLEVERIMNSPVSLNYSLDDS
jgi:nucleoporin GLE1